MSKTAITAVAWIEREPAQPAELERERQELAKLYFKEGLECGMSQEEAAEYTQLMLS